MFKVNNKDVSRIKIFEIFLKRFKVKKGAVSYRSFFVKT